jgi:hypothetical protein
MNSRLAKARDITERDRDSHQNASEAKTKRLREFEDETALLADVILGRFSSYLKGEGALRTAIAILNEYADLEAAKPIPVPPAEPKPVRKRKPRATAPKRNASGKFTPADARVLENGTDAATGAIVAAPEVTLPNGETV